MKVMSDNTKKERTGRRQAVVLPCIVAVSSSKRCSLSGLCSFPILGIEDFACCRQVMSDHEGAAAFGLSGLNDAWRRVKSPDICQFECAFSFMLACIRS